MKRNDVENDMQDARAHRSSNTLAKVPVVVLMAMSPAMLNANHPKINAETENPAKTEMVTAPSKLNTEALDELTAAYPRVEELQQSGDIKQTINRYFGGAYDIADIKEYSVNGVKKYMVLAAMPRTKNIQQVFIVTNKSNYNRKTNKLPWVRELIYHDIGSSDKNFCSLIIDYLEVQSDGKLHLLRKNERIPDAIANEFVELLTGRSGYKNSTGIEFSETNSAALQSDKNWYQK